MCGPTDTHKWLLAIFMSYLFAILMIYYSVFISVYSRLNIYEVRLRDSLAIFYHNNLRYINLFCLIQP